MCGIKIINPISAANIAATSTPAADKSFVFFIVSLNSSVIESARFSIAELNSSAMKTIPMAKIIKTHSMVVIFNQIPREITKIAAIK